MLCVAALGSVMSSTGVVAVFVPVAIAVSQRLDASPRQVLMPLSFAGLISGMLTLIATAPNLVVNAELARHGLDGFGFFAPTPFGLVVLALGIVYMLLVRRWIGDAQPHAGRAARRTIADLMDAYALADVPRRVQVGEASELAGKTLLELDLPGRHGLIILAIERGPFWRRVLLAAKPKSRLAAQDVLTVQVLPAASAEPELWASLGLEEVDFSPEEYAQQARQVGIAELMVPPNSATSGRRVRDLDFPGKYGLTVIGVRA